MMKVQPIQFGANYNKTPIASPSLFVGDGRNVIMARSILIVE